MFNIHSTKTKRIISGVIIALLIVAMVLPMLLSTF
jgi:tetrahydromethanopterin S-methyltransferase subunit F